MKRTILLFLFFIPLYYLSSNEVDVETAKSVAINFMDLRRDNNAIKNVLVEKQNGQNILYIINFQDSGYVMVSAVKSTAPVLVYSLSGEYKLDDETPDGFMQVIDNIKSYIENEKKLKSANEGIIEKWNNLLEPDYLKTTINYTPGHQLLNVPGRGHVRWRQSLNHDNGCEPSYNKFCPSGSGYYCGKRPAGCGAVAMGQIMWYWQWPDSSLYRTYHWGSMSSVLKNGGSDEIPHLLRDCGLASNMRYRNVLGNYFSWTTMNEIVDAYKNEFNYETAQKHIKKYWCYGNGSAWEDLIRSEIDNGRPVLYRGDEATVNFTKHYFVIDGYDDLDPDLFWINMGWGPHSDNIISANLDAISGYNSCQRAIVGTSPTYPSPANINLLDVPYSIVTDTKSEEARQDIALPAPGKALIIENGGELNLLSGNSITLKPGFYAKAGSKFSAHINPVLTEEMDITVPKLVNAFIPNNQPYWLEVFNANSWEFEVSIYPSGARVFQSAGTITDNHAVLWDGSGAYPGTHVYLAILRFKNNYGREFKSIYDITVFN